MRIVLTSIILALSIVSVAAQELVCRPRDAIINSFQNDGAEPVFMGKTVDGIMEVWTDNEDFAVLFSKDGSSCFIAAGKEPKSRAFSCLYKQDCKKN
jgi:hypothetical protein